MPVALPTSISIRQKDQGGLDHDEQEQVDLTGFQVVRREFFAHTREPSIIFNDGTAPVTAPFTWIRFTEAGITGSLPF